MGVRSGEYREAGNEKRNDLASPRPLSPLLMPRPSPLTTSHSPLATRPSPLTTRHSPLATHHSPLTTRHSPLATLFPRGDWHPAAGLATVEGPLNRQIKVHIPGGNDVRACRTL